MTNQEAIKWIKEHHATDLDGCKDSDAMNLAIKALEMQEQKQVICPNCKSDRICWDGDYGHEGAIVQEYTCKDCASAGLDFCASELDEKRYNLIMQNLRSFGMDQRKDKEDPQYDIWDFLA